MSTTTHHCLPPSTITQLKRLQMAPGMVLHYYGRRGTNLQCYKNQNKLKAVVELSQGYNKKKNDQLSEQVMPCYSVAYKKQE